MIIREGPVDHVQHIDRNNSVIREVSRPEARSFECVEQEIDTQHAEVALNQYRVAGVGGLGWRIDGITDLPASQLHGTLSLQNLHQHSMLDRMDTLVEKQAYTLFKRPK
jgi:hypothetical protein